MGYKAKASTMKARLSRCTSEPSRMRTSLLVGYDAVGFPELAENYV